jgi:hypothetical protein
VSDERTAASGALGGASNEAGAEQRARVGALLATAVIRHQTLDQLALPVTGGAAMLLQAESDDPVDDLVVHLDSGNHVYVQVKCRVTFRGAADAPLRLAIKQFGAAVRPGLQPGDRLVLACATASQSIRRLGVVVERRRAKIQGAPTTKEQKALSDFRDMAASHCSPEEVEKILDHLLIWESDPTQGDGAGMLNARLDGHIAAPGKGGSAAEALSGIVRKLARTRTGMDALQLTEALAAREVPLAAGAPVSSPVAWATALMTFRERAVRRGTTLELFGAPAGLRHLPFDATVESVSVLAPDSGWDGPRWLAFAQRRRGRTVLIADAGTGKSTALRIIAAHWAARVDWPVPVLVRLPRVASSSLPLMDAIVEAAVAHLPVGAERDKLRLALGHALSRGRCLLALDGLDEVRPGRGALVDELAELLGDLHEGNEVIVATRPVAAEEAAAVGLRPMWLEPPNDLSRTVDLILAAARPLGAPQTWERDRAAWVDAAVHRDPELFFTPLMTIILSFIAVSAPDLEGLPRTRAAIIRWALDDVIDRWEIEHRYDDAVTIGSLSGSEAKGALREALFVLSDAIIGIASSDLADVRSGIEEVLREAYDLPRGRARAAAEDSIAFWDEAGLVVIAGEELDSRFRSFAEFGSAWAVTEHRSADAEDWTAHMRTAPELWESLAMGAGLMPTIADAWARGVASDGAADEFIIFADAVIDGAPVSEPALVAVVDAVVDRLPSAGEDAERVVEALTKLQLPEAVQARVRPALIEHVPAKLRAVVDVLAILGWDEHGDAVDDRLRAFVERPTPTLFDSEDLEDEDEDEELRQILLSEPPSIATDYLATLDAAALRVAAISRRDAEFIVERHSSGLYEYAAALVQTLRDAGHHDLAERLEHDQEEELRQRRAMANDDNVEHRLRVRRLFKTIAEVAPPALLTQVQLRRLDELADLYASVAPGYFDREGDQLPEGDVVRQWIEVVVELGCFDRGVIAAQAAVALDEFGDDEDIVFFIGDGELERWLDGWSAAADPGATLRTLLDLIGRLPHASMPSLRDAIVTAPDPRSTVKLLEDLLPQREWWAREQIGWLLLDYADAISGEDGGTLGNRWGQTWLASADPFLRRAAADWWGRRAAEAPEELERCLADPERGVRVRAVSRLMAEPVTPSMRKRLEQLAAAPPVPWACDYCGHSNTARHGCQNCHQGRAPQLDDALKTVLGTWGRSLPQRPPELRRVRRRSR